MFDDLDSIFHNQLVLNFDKYRRLRNSRVVGNDQSMIAAVECATALFHFREHIPSDQQKSRHQVVRECPDYRLVADVCNVTKHSNLTRPTSEGTPLVRVATDIYELLIITRFQDDEGDYTDSEAIVNVDCSDEKTRCLDDAIVGALNFWGNELKRLGIRKFKSFNYLPYPGTQHVLRECAKSANFVATQGQRFCSRQQLLVFDATLGRAVPMDLTGRKVRMNIYRPNHCLEVTVAPSSGGEPLKFEIELSDEQSQQYARLDSDADRELLLQKFAKERQDQIHAKLSDVLKKNDKFSD